MLTPDELEQAKCELRRLGMRPGAKPTVQRCSRCNGKGRLRVGLGHGAHNWRKCQACAGEGRVSSNPNYSLRDAELMTRYPRHTLAQAREIDGATREPGIGITSGFEKIVAQERGDFHLTGDHT